MLYAYFSISAAVDLKGKKEILKTNLIDYLENNISVRIPQSKKEQERLDKLETAAENDARQEKDPAPGTEYEKGTKDVCSENEKEGTEETAVKTEEKQAQIADFAAHKKKEEEKKLAPEEIKELEGLLLEFVYHSY
jgi:hypothetical protein